MSAVDLCTEQEAAAIAGVSPKTLSRFSDAGYLTRHTQVDGSNKYERSQIEEIFGISNTDLSASLSTTETGGPPFISLHDASTTHSDHSQIIESLHPDNNEGTAPISEISDVEDSHEQRPAGDISTDSHIVSGMQEEIARLRNLLSLQERILDSKEDEIADLKSQRAWLRERIEKLEEKSDRDQILLLSETQTIRSLIAYQESRKSAVRQLLEWAGICKATDTRALPNPSEYSPSSGSKSPNARAIEVTKVANS